MGVRRHPVVLAAILSDFVVRVMDIAAAINRGRHAGLDRPLIRALASGLGRDVDRAREYAQGRHLALALDVTVTRYAILSLTLDQARERYLALTLIGYLGKALTIARELIRAVPCAGRDWSGDDLARAGGLVASLDSALDRARTLALDLDRELGKARERSLDRSLSRALDLAVEYACALDRVCAQGVAGRLGISLAEGLAGALLDGALDDFTSADLTCAMPATLDLTGVRWSLSGTAWPPETDVRALLARSSEAEPGSGVLVVKRPGTDWLPRQLAD